MFTSESYRWLLGWFYPLFWGLSLLSQCCMIYAIAFRTPKYLQTLKIILINTCAFQVIHVSVCWLMQFRQMSNLVPVEIWSYGPARYWPPWMGYILYHVLQTATFGSGISVVITLFLKYEAARPAKMEPKKKKMIIAGLLSPLFISVAMELILIFTQSLPYEIRQNMAAINVNVEDHSIIGFVDFRVYASVVNAAIMSSSVFLLPIVGLLCRKKIKAHMKNTTERCSESKQADNQTFLMGLTVQTFLPLLFYCPISCAYFFSVFLHEEVLFQQFTMFLFPAFPSLFDPYITIYFVTPYRNTVKAWLTKHKIAIFSSPKRATMVSTITTNHFT